MKYIDNDVSVSSLGIHVPTWINATIDCDPLDITVNDMAAILEGGCASGAWMPAVTYCDARKIMGADGDMVEEYLDRHDTYTTTVEDYDLAGNSFSAYCCHMLSCAVELWCRENHEEAVRRAEEAERAA